MAERFALAAYERAEVIADAILRGLGGAAPPWRVIEVREEEHPVPLQLLVRVGSTARAAVGVYYDPGRDEEAEVEDMATGIQDHALRETGGLPLPPCPGHPHPLTPRGVDGVAHWVCPRDPAHHAVPILPRS